MRRNLPELTMLPSRETPAIIYMGSTKDGKKALMTVSSDVQAIFGDAKCVLGSETCQLLVMEPGLPETFVYGGDGRTYKIELLKSTWSKPTSSTAPRSASRRRTRSKYSGGRGLSEPSAPVRTLQRQRRRLRRQRFSDWRESTWTIRMCASARAHSSFVVTPDQREPRHRSTALFRRLASARIRSTMTRPWSNYLRAE